MTQIQETQNPDTAAFQALLPKPLSRAKFRALIILTTVLLVVIGAAALYAPRMLRTHLNIGGNNLETYSSLEALLACEPASGAGVVLEAVPVQSWGWPESTVEKLTLTPGFMLSDPNPRWFNTCADPSLPLNTDVAPEILGIWILPLELTDSLDDAAHVLWERRDSAKFSTDASVWLQQLQTAGFLLKSDYELPQTLNHEQRALLVVLSVGYSGPLHNYGTEVTTRSIFATTTTQTLTAGQG
ncbi:MAG: hypothetical protein LBC29_05755 [Propionibacteriaceae bacterium]|nr:hypothetical protein [Propionibacteriaceae bacterium]